MEFLKSQLGLRSLDMEGRSLGTERPSVSISGRSAPESSSGERFGAYLRSRTSRAADSTGGAEQAVERVAERIREGRTDAASERYNARRERAAIENRRPASEDALEQRLEEGATAASERSAEADSGQRVRRPSGRRQGSGDPGGPESGRSEDVAAGPTGDPDAAALTGAADDPDPSDALPGSVVLPLQPLSSGPAGAVAVATPPAAGGAVPTHAAAAAPGLAPLAQRGGQTAPASPPVAPTASAAPGETRAARATAPPPPAASPERAEAILDQLRVRIQSGDREAIIHLRPDELGRVRLHVRVEGGAIHASIAAESAEALAVLEAHGPELRAWLARDGAESVELRFEAFTAEDRAAADAREEPARRGRGQRDGGPGGRSSDASLATPEALTRALGALTEGDGVDLVA